jgi:hypothetical protein
VSQILKNIFSRGPFSAVRPYLGGSGKSRPAREVPEPSDRFDRSEETAEPSAPSTEKLRQGARRSGTEVALRAFPQVVHLLVNPENDWGENLSKQVGLPLISLDNGSVENLEAELAKPQYANGFILEGFPSDAKSAEQLEDLLENVSEDDRRVVGWDLSNDSHQEVIDHYVNRDLLWMVPESADPESSQEAQQHLMSCLVGLPALQ